LLDEGLSTPAALRKARTLLRQSGIRGLPAGMPEATELAQHPFFWAPFICIGPPD
jgi:CHAT domain-containing protein